MGALNGIAPPLEASGFSYLPSTNVFAPNITPAIYPSDLPSSESLSFPQTGWTDDQDVSFQPQLGGLDGTDSNDETALRIGGGGGLVGDGGENSDEYWNALIDGALPCGV